MDETYVIGQSVRINFETRNIAGELVDVSGVTIEIKDPGGTIVPRTLAAAQVTRASLGSYYTDFKPTLTGTHYVWASSTNLDAAAKGEFLVKRKFDA